MSEKRGYMLVGVLMVVIGVLCIFLFLGNVNFGGGRRANVVLFVDDINECGNYCYEVIGEVWNTGDATAHNVRVYAVYKPQEEMVKVTISNVGNLAPDEYRDFIGIVDTRQITMHREYFSVDDIHVDWTD